MQNTSRSSSSNLISESGNICSQKWASRLLLECAEAIAGKNTSKIHHLLWMLNELASPYGDLDQKLASHFLQALFCKATEYGEQCYKSLISVAEKNHCFESTRKMILKFQEVSPWTTFGHVASNGAILQAFEGENKLHIIDISNTFCTQWPTLLESLATRNDDETPQLKLTVVITATMERSVLEEIGHRLKKFARLMGVPFEFNVVSGLAHICNLTKDDLSIEEDEAVAINCIGALRRINVDERGAVARMFHGLRPRVVTVVEEEADFTSTRNDFVKCFEECLRFYNLYFEMLNESFVSTSNERLMLEKECSRSIVSVLACNDDSSCEESERRERSSQWCNKLKECFSAVGFSDDAVDDAQSLLKRYPAGWSLLLSQGDPPVLFLTWKDEPVVWASAWKP
ncbi:hypothetical protein NE237_022289 [Protea cynaroides]|uniref:Protein SHORT-ROOT-like n=1 Tax=Protea cynaroides TaxID=273540 RepID=A0A9Q0HCW8_9MAGN|nr:hypothetical protein NE237_022289 [Protea cynaroides]